MTMLAERVDVVIGVDTHKHTHTAAVVNATTGGVLAQATVTADPAGYDQLLALAAEHPAARAWALEGAGGYGAGLTRHLRAAGEEVSELDRPRRPARRGGVKSDAVDAIRAARDALARTWAAQPKTGAARAALAVHTTARRSAVQAVGDSQRQLQALIVTAPEVVRARFRGHRTAAQVAIAAKLRPHTATGDAEVAATLTVLRALARRITVLQAEADDHEKAITTHIRAWRPDILDHAGVGPIVAATVLCAWSHPGRFPTEAAFAMLAGAAPIPASSGMTTRHRLNRAGDRQLNRALHTIVITRWRTDPITHAYIERRRAQGKTDREIRRCLKRYIARDLFRLLEHPHPTP